MKEIRGWRALFVLVVFALVCTTAESQERNIPIEQAVKKIREHERTIEEKTTSMEERYGYDASVKTMDGYLEGRANRKYREAWGRQGLYLTWDTVKAYYDDHREALEASVEAVRKAGGARPEELHYLASGMNAWAETEGKIRTLFDRLCVNYQDLGKSYNMIFYLQDRVDEITEKYLDKYLKTGKDYTEEKNAELRPVKIALSRYRKKRDKQQKKGKELKDDLSRIGRNVRHFSALNTRERGKYVISRLTVEDDAWLYRNSQQSRRIQELEKRIRLLEKDLEKTKQNVGKKYLEYNRLLRDQKRRSLLIRKNRRERIALENQLPAALRGSLKMNLRKIARAKRRIRDGLDEMSLKERNRLIDRYKKNLAYQKDLERMVEEHRKEIDYDRKQKKLEKERKRLDEAYWENFLPVVRSREAWEGARDRMRSLKEDKQELRQELLALREKMGEMPVLQSLVVRKEGEVVFKADRSVTRTEIKKLNRKIKKARELVARSRKNKDLAFEKYKKNQEETIDALQEVRGKIVESTVYLAVIQTGFNVYDVADAWMTEGGPAAALATAVMKGVEVVAFGYLPFENVDEDQLEKRINDEFGAEITDPVSTQQLYELGVKKTISKTVSKKAKKEVVQPWLEGLLRSRTQEIIAKNLEVVDELGTPKTIGKWNKILKFSGGLVKDTVKEGLKFMAKEMEAEAWRNYYIRDRIAAVSYQVYRLAQLELRSNLNLVEELLDEKQERLGMGTYDYDSGLLETSRRSFQEGETLTGSVKFRPSPTPGFVLRLGNRESQSSGDGTFSIQANELTANPSGGPVPIVIRLK